MNRLYVSLLLILSACSENGRAPDKATRENIENAVHTAVLADPAVVHHPDGPVFVDPMLSTFDARINLTSERAIRSGLSAASAFVVSDFLSASQHAGQLRQTTLPAIQAGESASIQIDKGQTESKRAASAANGRTTIALSHVGIDLDAHEAIVFYRMRCGMECGAGEMILLTEQSGKWRVASRMTLWVA